MTDLVERLRKYCDEEHHEAAAEIERLRAELAQALVDIVGLQGERNNLRERVAELESDIRRANSWAADLASGLSDALAQRDAARADKSALLIAVDTAFNERDAARAEVERFRKLYWLAAQDVIFFSGYDENSNTWPDGHYSPCVLFNDTFAYACADGEPLTDDQIDNLTDVYKRWGQDGVVAWGANRRNCEPLEPLRTAKYREARAAIDAARGQHE